MPQAITPHERRAATLRFLATGMSYENLKFSTIKSSQALGKIIPETCHAIYEVLKEYYKVRVYNVKNIIYKAAFDWPTMVIIKMMIKAKSLLFCVYS